jgi:nucleotide-binding universal stress UspA family protein
MQHLRGYWSTKEDMMKVKTILVPTDFSEHAERSYAQAIEFAKVFGARIHLLHVYDIPDLASTYEIAFPDRIDTGIRKAARRKLESLRERATGEGIEVATHLAFGAPERVITQHAKDEHVDLIVMGTRGLGAVKQLLLGSVAERTIRAAACSVLVVQDPERAA